MEVLQKNPNPKRSKQGEKQTINNPYTPKTVFYPSLSYPNGATRAMLEAMPYGKKTLAQEFTNIRNQDLSLGTRNQQQFGEMVYSQNIPSLPRN
jgi:hypothetical protein